ncbi:hypothetical protein Q1695_015886 [Nippostrongylus brasiliensis]|nr:hypothetical protein Q1695_015886 [Nippostrongylus brasiliensis]
MSYFEKFHEGMNLRSDCEMMREAYRAADLLFTGAAYNYDPRWCQYSKWFYDTLHIIAVKTRAGAPAYKMPWKKISQTSKLHPKAKYGCAYRSSDISKFGGALYLTICLYERNPEETRCFCN